ncbi:MAG: TIGR00725 family protein [Bacillota bacterium]|nr:TIGR00725 family protein [Bacillota bacterium]
MYYIAVVGGSQCSVEEESIAFEVGRSIAQKGGTVICGGGPGVMEAAARGADSAGGVAIGILPGPDHREGNRYLKYSIATGLGEARNAIITRTADAVIAVGGEYGTLSEIALAMKMGKPVITVKSWSISPPGKLKTAQISVNNADDAVSIAINKIKQNE